jgi:hypothetical protein
MQVQEIERRYGQGLDKAATHGSPEKGGLAAGDIRKDDACVQGSRRASISKVHGVKIPLPKGKSRAARASGKAATHGCPGKVRVAVVGMHTLIKKAVGRMMPG